MTPEIIKVQPQKDYQLLLTFDNEEMRVFDMKKYIYRSNFFRQLEDEDYFKTVRVSLGSIEWKNGQDLSPATLYLSSKLLDIEMVEKDSIDYLEIEEAKLENNSSYSIHKTREKLSISKN
jgi:hypothetical protein